MRGENGKGFIGIFIYKWTKNSTSKTVKKLPFKNPEHKRNHQRCVSTLLAMIKKAEG